MNLVKSLLLFGGLGTAGAFVPLLQEQPGLVGQVSSTRLHAESGAPQYEKRQAILREAELVGDGSVMLHIEKRDGDDESLDYEPGHVLALEIQGNPDSDEIDEKTAKDMRSNDGWMRGPYTVTRCNEKSLDILMKVVGAKSKAFATADPGTPVQFGGKFKVPIAKGIAPKTERVCLISTGVGVGPCVGAVEELLSQNFAGKIDLFASFRYESEKLFADSMNTWTNCYENFRYKPVITSEVGRLSSSEDNVQLVTNEDICSVSETHYHLIGNGQMVSEWKAGLAKAGVPDERITIESYFNHKSEPSEQAIERIAAGISAASMNPVK